MSRAGSHNIRGVVIARANGKCQVCHWRDAVEVTHIVKRPYPRPNAEQDKDNYIAVCKVCHPKFDAQRDAKARGTGEAS